MIKLSKNWNANLSTFLWFGALLFPLFWIVINGILRTPVYVAGGLYGLYMLKKVNLQWGVRAYLRWAILAALLTFIGFFRLDSPSLVIDPIWYFLSVFYAIPAGMVLAHAADEAKPILNWIFIVMMLLFAVWSFLVMGRTDVDQIVKFANDTITRGDQLYPVDMFGFFHCENVKMGIIPWCAYPLAAVMAIACRGSIISRGILLAGAGLACYVAGAFLTRTIFIAGGFASLIIVLVYIIKADRRRRFAMLGTVLLLTAVVALIIHFIPVVNDYVMGLTDRFNDAADDERQYLWAAASKLIVKYPLGGGDVSLEEHMWAHDLPLDMGLLYGIPGILAMSALLLMLVAAVFKWILRLPRDVQAYEIILMSLFIAALVSSLISPPDLAYLTPLLLVGAFARERNRMDATRSRVHAIIAPANDPDPVSSHSSAIEVHV